MLLLFLSHYAEAQWWQLKPVDCHGLKDETADAQKSPELPKGAGRLP